MKYTLTLSCWHTDTLERSPKRSTVRGVSNWLNDRTCPEKGCRGPKRVVEIHTEKGGKK